MTNFQANTPPQPARWLNPENAVLFLPIAAGVVAAISLFVLVILPTSIRSHEQRLKLNEFRGLRLELPFLKTKLSNVKGKLRKMDEQQLNLLKLVAGVTELDTLLAELNALADQTGVTVTRANPGETQFYQAALTQVDGQDQAPPAAGGEELRPSDPLLRKGLEKRSAELVLSGAFRGLVMFIRELERLEVFVEISDLSLTERGISKASAAPGGGAMLDLALTITAYGRRLEDR